MSEGSTEPGLRWGAVAIGLLAVGWGAGLGVRPVLAYGLVHTAALALLWLYPRRSLRQVRLERRAPPTACEEDAVSVRLDLHNEGPLPLFAPEVEDLFTPDAAPRRRAVAAAWVPGRARVAARYGGRCEGRRGEYVIGPGALEVTCPLGLFGARRLLLGRATLTVLPTLERIPLPPLRGVGRAPRAGASPRRQPGDGERALAVREYRAGDPLRRVHWATTARRGKLSLIEPERELARRVTIALDLSRASLRGLGRQATVEVAVRAAAALAAALLRAGDRVGLVAHERAPILIPPGRGAGQLCRLLEVLAVVRPRGERPLRDLVRELAVTLRSGETAALFVADVDADAPALLEAVEAMRGRALEVVAVLLDPRTFPRLTEPAQAPRSVEEVAEALRRRGATVYVARAGEALAETFLHPWQGRRRVRLTRAALR